MSASVVTPRPNSIGTRQTRPGHTLTHPNPPPRCHLNNIPPPSPASQTAAAPPAPTLPPPSQAPFCTISGQGGGNRRRGERGGAAVKMSVAPGCHRRAPLRMAFLPRPLGDARDPRTPTGRRASSRPSPPRPHRPPHLSPTADSRTQTVPHVISHQRHTKTQPAPRVSPGPGGHPIPPLQGDSRDHPPPQPQDEVGEGAS